MSVDLTVAHNLNTNLQLVQDKNANQSALALGTNSVRIGTETSMGNLQIINLPQDAGGNTLILGPTNASNLRLGYHTDYSWVQSHGSKPLAINPIGNNVGIGTATSEAKLQVINQSQDADGNTLILGPTNASNLRLGYHTDYSWVQSHGSTPLAINPIGNNVGIGTANPSTTLDVNGTVKAKGLQVEALVLPKNPSPSGSAPNVPNPQPGQIFWDESSIWVYTGQWEKAHLGTL